MSLPLQQPILYLITSGATTPWTEASSPEFKHILTHVAAAVRAGINLIQLREKNLTARVLYELAARAAEITRESATRLLVNDRADIARAAHCDGVHLATHSMKASAIRSAFGPSFLIGASTHSIEEARVAKEEGASFAVFGPIFDTPSKRAYGSPLGLKTLEEAARNLSPFPLIALGGITRSNAPQVLESGAQGIAAIRLFADTGNLETIAREIKSRQKGRMGGG